MCSTATGDAPGRARAGGHPWPRRRGRRDRLLRRGRALREAAGRRQRSRWRTGADACAPFPSGRASSSTALPSRLSARPPPTARAPRDVPPRGRSLSPTPAPASPSRAASTSRAATTPSSSSGSGATTSASRAWSSNTWAASTTLRPWCATSNPAATAGSGRARRPPRRGQQGGAPRGGDHVAARLVDDHPYVDVWQAVRPAAVGIAGWPQVPRGQPWKEGVCRSLGWPIDTAAAWRRILGCVNSYADLEPSLLGRVEEVIDFVTAQPG